MSAYNFFLIKTFYICFCLNYFKYLLKFQKFICKNSWYIRNQIGLKSINYFLIHVKAHDKNDCTLSSTIYISGHLPTFFSVSSKYYASLIYFVIIYIWKLLKGLIKKNLLKYLCLLANKTKTSHQTKTSTM